MKKLFTLALSSVAILGLAACGGKKKTDPKPQPSSGESSPAVDPLDEVLAIEEGKSFHCVGGHLGADPAVAWAAIEGNKMTAASVNQVKALDATLGAALARKSLKYLYTFDLTIGEEDLGWTAKKVINGEEIEVDGKFTLKAIEAAYNEEEGNYTNTHWIPNPADSDCCHAEALTNNIFIPPYQKEADEHGLSWSDNPVMDVEAGNYTFVLAQYTVPSTQDVCGYGFGLVARA